MFLRTSPLCKGHATSIIKRVAHETHPRLVPRSLQSTLHDWPFAVCSLLSASPLQRQNLNQPSAPCFTPGARLAAGLRGMVRFVVTDPAPRFKVQDIVRRCQSVTG